MADSQALPPAEPAPGISRTLASWRSAHYREVRYALRIELLPPFERVTGTLELDVVLETTPVGPGAGLAWRDHGSRVARSACQRETARADSLRTRSRGRAP